MAKAWPKEIYMEKSIKELILVAFYVLNKEEVSFEDVLGRCFLLFPERFCFKKKKKWPDARILGRPLRSLRREGMVKGSPEKGFFLTGKGEKKAFEIFNLLRQKRLELG